MLNLPNLNSPYQFEVYYPKLGLNVDRNRSPITAHPCGSYMNAGTTAKPLGFEVLEVGNMSNTLQADPHSVRSMWGGKKSEEFQTMEACTL